MYTLVSYIYTLYTRDDSIIYRIYKVIYSFIYKKSFRDIFTFVIDLIMICTPISKFLSYEKYAGIKNSLNYDESEDIQTLKKENNNEDVLVLDTFQTDDEISALCSAINIIGETIDNTLEGEWADEEQEEQYKQTMKHLCRLSNRYPDRMGRKLI